MTLRFCSRVKTIVAAMGATSVLLFGACSSKAESADPTSSPSSIQFVTLGTGGGPRVQVQRSQPANAVLIGDDAYLLDIGEGTQRQLKSAGIRIDQVRAVFLSHHHTDHVAGLSPLLVNRWINGHYEPLSVFGPPGTEQMVTDLLIAARPTELAPVVMGVDTPPLDSTARGYDFAGDMTHPEVIFSTAALDILAITNSHYHFTAGTPSNRLARSYAFRIEWEGRAIVYTGDTGPSESVTKLALGADLLVSEVQDLGAIEASLRADNLPPALLEGVLAHLRLSHLSPTQVGQMAAASDARAVVLTHFVPGLDGETTEGYLAGLSDHYDGPVTLAADLQVFNIEKGDT